MAEVGSTDGNESRRDRDIKWSISQGNKSGNLHGTKEKAQRYFQINIIIINGEESGCR